MSDILAADDFIADERCPNVDPHADHCWHINGKRITIATPDRLKRICPGVQVPERRWPGPAGLPVLAALNQLGKQMYQGTVPAKERARRRAASKRARLSRRINRRRAA